MTRWKLFNWIGQRKRAYQMVFNGPMAEDVLADLARFCRANSTTFHEDPRIHAALEGRRETFLRITQHLKLTPDQLWALYDRSAPPTGDDE